MGTHCSSVVDTRKGKPEKNCKQGTTALAEAQDRPLQSGITAQVVDKLVLRAGCPRHLWDHGKYSGLDPKGLEDHEKTSGVDDHSYTHSLL